MAEELTGSQRLTIDLAPERLGRCYDSALFRHGMVGDSDKMLGDAQVDAIVDYLNALQETPGPL